MTSAEIRQAIKMTMDLAPAIMRAAEIVDAAEIAEQAVADAAQRKRAIEQDAQELVKTAAARRADVVAVNEELDRAKQDAQAEKAKLNKSLGVTQGKLEQAQAALAATQAEHAAFLRSIEAEIHLKRTELEGLKHEMDALLAKLRP